MNDKEFYREFLRQAEGYVVKFPAYDYYLCYYPWQINGTYNSYLNRFGYIVSNKIGEINHNPKNSSLNKYQRKEVMTELISYLKDKLNQLK